MWEREPVLGAVARLLERARSGAGGTLFVVGQAGLGKTAVIERARERAGAEFQVGAGTGDAMETALPFGLFVQAQAGLGGGRMLEPTVAALSGGDARATRFYEVLRWLEGLAGRPVLLPLDDLP